MILNFGCCFYPTTVVCVDDDTHLLHWMVLLLEGSFNIVSFHDPIKCVAFIKKELSAKRNNAITSFYDESMGDVRAHIKKIHQLIYDAGRNKEISTLVVDYYMPAMNGLELCELFKKDACKKIILTGEGDQSLAVKAFNNASIDQFVMKGQANALEDTQVQVKRMQQQYFIEKTRFFLEFLTRVEPMVFSYFDDVDLCVQLDLLLQKRAIKEIYLFSHDSEYLMIDHENKIWWLSIMNQYSVDMLIQTAENELLQEPSPEVELVFNNIKSKRQFPLHALSKKILEIKDWERILTEPIVMNTAKETYHILLAPDLGLADLRYQDIKFIK
jgi:CheY-like chemotaxis protein